MNVGSRRWFIFVVVLLSHTVSIRGEVEGETEGEDTSSTNDGLEEVSIEAVEFEANQPSGSLSYFDRNRNEETDSYDSSLTNSSSAQPTDNSTALATVYPDISDGLSDSNSTANATMTNGTTPAGRYLRVKVSCSELVYNGNLTTDESGSVEIVNMTHLMHGVLVTNPTIKTRSTPSNCTVVMFYTHWCPWSAKAAPHFNALPRAFKNIRFAAIDSSVHTAVNTYFGILSVPTVVLFYNGKILAKFNETTFSVNQFAEFIATFTDQKPGIRLNVTSMDFVGPISSVVTKGHDWYLYLAWIFIIVCAIKSISRTAVWHRMLELVQNSWREAEAVASVPPPPHHFHQD